jgi:hypothetical protein
MGPRISRVSEEQRPIALFKEQDVIRNINQCTIDRQTDGALNIG